VERLGAKAKCAAPPYEVPRSDAFGAHGPADLVEALLWQGVHVRIGDPFREPGGESVRLRSARTERADSRQEQTLLLCTHDIHRVHHPRSVLGHAVNACDDAEPQEKRRHVARQPLTAGAEIDPVASASGSADMNASIRGPEMPDQEPDLRLRQGEHGLGKVLLMGPLAEETELLEPRPDTGRMPAVSVAADD
jgi:hypothetical protein